MPAALQSSQARRPDGLRAFVRRHDRTLPYSTHSSYFLEKVVLKGAALSLKATQSTATSWLVSQTLLSLPVIVLATLFDLISIYSSHVSRSFFSSSHLVFTLAFAPRRIQSLHSFVCRISTPLIMVSFTSITILAALALPISAAAQAMLHPPGCFKIPVIRRRGTSPSSNPKTGYADVEDLSSMQLTADVEAGNQSMTLMIDTAAPFT